MQGFFDRTIKRIGFGAWVKKLVKDEVDKQVVLRKPPALPNKEHWEQSTDSFLSLPGANHTILKKEDPCYVFGFLDLSDLKHGDKIEVILSIKAKRNQKVKPHLTREYAGPLAEPIVEFTPRFAEGIEVKIKQVSGERGRKIEYNWRWKNLT